MIRPVLAITGMLALGPSCKPELEQPAPPEQFVVVTDDGQQLKGAQARIDIRFTDPRGPADVELFFSASAPSGATWSAYTKPTLDFFQSRALAASLTAGPLAVGKGVVERKAADGTVQQAPAGELQVRIEGRRLVGELTRANAGFGARFAGPFVVTCSVPLPGAPVGQGGVLTVDEKFETERCRPFAAFAGR